MQSAAGKRQEVSPGEDNALTMQHYASYVRAMTPMQSYWFFFIRSGVARCPSGMSTVR
jgi:hypothetical protein